MIDLQGILPLPMRQRRTIVNSFMISLPPSQSQALQDWFVITVLKGQHVGTFLEIGANDPISHSNSYVLETCFKWDGVSIELDPTHVFNFRSRRTTRCICSDATTICWADLFKSCFFSGDIDYLSLDIEPANQTFSVLLQLPLHRYKFRVITYEHDSYISGDTYRQLSRQLLQSYGYELVVPDVTIDGWGSFEDWYVHPSLIDDIVLSMLRSAFGGSAKNNIPFIKKALLSVNNSVNTLLKSPT